MGFHMPGVWPPRPQHPPRAAVPPKPSRDAQVPPPATEDRDRVRLGAAAYHAKRLLPPAVGKLVARELEAAQRFGYLTPDGVVWEAAAELIKMANRDAIAG